MVSTSDDEIERVTITMSRTIVNLARDRLSRWSQQTGQIDGADVKFAADNDQKTVRGDNLEQTDE